MSMAAAEAPWYAAYPAPRNKSPGSISREQLLQRLEAGQQSGKEFLLVDLRRMDHEGGTINGALNLPAQSLYESLETLYTLCNAASIEIVIWWCGSSRGRGTRAAGWFDDLIAEKKDGRMKSVTLEEGIKGWALAGEKYQKHMVGLDKAAWE